MNNTRSSNAKGKLSVKNLTVVGLMTAVLCLSGPFSIPLPMSPVPISLATLAIYFIVYVLGAKKGALSCLLYLLIGLVGIPVFSSFSAGPGKLLGPTGGYLIGYILMAYICGLFIDKSADNRLLCLIGMILGTLVCYGFGSIWLAYQAGISFSAALMAGVIPFIPGDLVKILIALLAGSPIRKALVKADLIAT